MKDQPKRRTRRRPHQNLSRLLAGTALAALASTMLSTAPASAEETDSWFYHDLGYDQLHVQGLDGEGITIAIVEVGLLPNSPDLEGADIEFIPVPEEYKIFNEIGEERNVVDPLARNSFQDLSDMDRMLRL